MTTLADLTKLATKANTLGFDTNEVQVQFKSGGETLALVDAVACVSVTADDTTPVLTINLTRLQQGNR